MRADQSRYSRSRFDGGRKPNHVTDKYSAMKPLFSRINLLKCVLRGRTTHLKQNTFAHFMKMIFLKFGEEQTKKEQLCQCNVVCYFCEIHFTFCC